MSKLATCCAVFLALFLLGPNPAKARGGQDFPFFICSMQGEAHSTFYMGPSVGSATGYALWRRGPDAQWQATPVTVDRANEQFVVKGDAAAGGFPFQAVIPVSCGLRCEIGSISGRPELCPDAKAICAQIGPSRDDDDR